MAITPIKLDFTSVEKSSYNTRQMPAGLYEARITEVVQKSAQDGTDMLVYTFAPTHPQYRGRRFPFYCKLSSKQLWKLRDLLVATGESIPKRAVRVQPEKIVNRLLCIEVSDDTYGGTVRSTVDSVYSWDVLRPNEKFSDKDYDEDEVEADDDESILSFTSADDSEEVEDIDAEDFEGDSDFDEDDLDMTPEPPKKKSAKKNRKRQK